MLKKLPLPIGSYVVDIAVDVNKKTVDHIYNVLSFDIKMSSFYPTGLTPDVLNASCLIENDWTCE